MIVHNFNAVLLDLGLFQIRWYSLAYILGIIFGWIYARKIISSSFSSNYDFKSITKNQFDDLIIYIVFGIILGGRIGYVLFYNFEYFIQNFFEIFKVWNGGMSFHGGLLGVIIAILLFSKKEKENFFKFSDIVCCVAPIGIFLVRIANFINGELYGKITNVPWGVIFPLAGKDARHPSQIYEAFLEGLVLFIILNYIFSKKKLLFIPGYISSLFLIMYSVFRIFSESFREPDLHIGYFFNYLSMGTLLSVVTLLFGLILFFFIKKNEQNN